MNILFINPASLSKTEQSAFLKQTTGVGHGYSVRRVPGFAQPMGIVELASYVRSKIKNVSIDLIDFGTELYLLSKRQVCEPMTVEEFTYTTINSFNTIPDVIGISILYSTSFNSSMLIADLVKKKWPEAKVVIGGMCATHAYESILRNNAVDYVIRGEAELAFTRFIESIESDNPNDISTIEGVIDRNKLRAGATEMAMMLDNLDELPLPAYDLMDMDLYLREDKVAMMFSRGCPFKCTFCASPSVHGHALRERSNENIKKEIDYLIENWNIKSLVIYDDLIAANRKKFLSLSNDYLQHLDIKFKMPNALSVAVMTEELVDAFCVLNLDRFIFAVESGSSYTQKHLIKKRVNLSKARSLVEYTMAKNQYVFIDIILGVPYETRELMAETLDYCKSMDVDWIYFFSALPLPGTVMYEQFRSMGKINENDYDWDGIRHGRRTFNTDEISADELEDLCYDSNIEYNFLRNKNIENARYHKAIYTFNEVVLDQYPYHIVARYCRGVAKSGLNLYSDAMADFEECRRWVDSGDSEARWMYSRYGEAMPMLQSLLAGEQLALETIPVNSMIHATQTLIPNRSAAASSTISSTK